MQDFRSLKVWQRSHQLTLAVYRATAAFPSEERYGLQSQLRRCCSSIPSNIAEGCGRGSDADFSRFLQIAMGSASELEYFLLLVGDLRFLTTDSCRHLQEEVEEVRRMLNALIQKVRSPPPANRQSLTANR
jgi:four helix bundle protein